MKKKENSYLSSIDPSRICITLCLDEEWYCLVDRELYVVRTPGDYAYIRSRVKSFLSRIKNL